MYKRIVVPVDGSDIAEMAFPNALEIARTLNIPLHLVRVAEHPRLESLAEIGTTLQPIPTPELICQEMHLIEEYLKETSSELRLHHAAVTFEILHGTPQRALVDAMQPGDLFVMVTHGRSGVARWYMGSVSEQVMRHATVPLLMIRAGTSGSSRPHATTMQGAFGH